MIPRFKRGDLVYHPGGHPKCSKILDAGWYGVVVTDTGATDIFTGEHRSFGAEGCVVRHLTAEEAAMIHLRGVPSVKGRY